MNLSDGSRPPDSLAHDGGIFVRGLLMGSADVVPGVSGGTVALIVGIYQRLITAISHVDLDLLAMVRQGRVGDAARHLDLRFMVVLGSGIAVGIVALGGFVNTLLTTASSRGATLAAFLGMILASCALVGRMIPVQGRADVVRSVLLVAAGAAFAWWMTGLPTTIAAPSLSYVFFCGMVAICAMILPGLSGAYLLLVLGLYIYLTDILRRLPKLEVNAFDALTVAVFAVGCAIGIVGFSKILRRLLARLPGPTLAVLLGFMIGSLRKVWPFQSDLTPDIEKLSHKHFENVWPARFDGEVLFSATVAVVAMIAVFVIDRLTAGGRGPSGSSRQK